MNSKTKSLSVIILALTNSEELYKMTLNCINSLKESETNIIFEIIIIESNRDYLVSNFKYPDFAKVIIPDVNFNFHQYLNIGIKASTGDYIALCNNDLIFHKKWFSEILKVVELDNTILSFSPVGTIDVNHENIYQTGYKVRTHIMGWCIVTNKKLFNKIGYLDETFDFYYADNDYAMTLKSKNIKHAVVFNSKVEHLEKRSSKKKVDSQSFLYKYKIPQYLYKKEYEWVLNDEKSLDGFLKYHNKWGTPDFLYKKNKLADILIRYNLGYFIRFFL
ncbi:glycosyltransferase family 2 protein [Flavobacterium johnsoniae]|uniref:Glycosyltransferase, GT2 family n=1 Tax=Flavobacterium johnsoniae TaxID=986 RepID=A0A1M5L3U6_FLAJO|nr:glycosyltransferase [Flavobacterium johnsoniae]SHG59093.1 Glycosyltransferase, GT2 family [Flavobacterium johnsoniae]